MWFNFFFVFVFAISIVMDDWTCEMVDLFRWCQSKLKWPNCFKRYVRNHSWNDKTFFALFSRINNLRTTCQRSWAFKCKPDIYIIIEKLINKSRLQLTVFTINANFRLKFKWIFMSEQNSFKDYVQHTHLHCIEILTSWVAYKNQTNFKIKKSLDDGHKSTLAFPKYFPKNFGNFQN